MLEKLKAHKILAVILVILISGVAWALLSGGQGVQTISVLGSSSVPASRDGGATVGAVDRELQETLTRVRAIELNNQILNDPAFLSLQDLGQQIVPEPFGRPNPFAPISSQ